MKDLSIRYQVKYHKCNLNCPYCIVKVHKRESDFDLEKLQKGVENIKKLPYKVCLRMEIRGEIFTSPEILEVVRNICNEENNICGVNFSSNIHADWDTVIKPFVESVNTKKLGMGCTLHDTVEKDIDLFFQKVRLLKDQGILLYVGYVALPQRIGFIKGYKKICHDLGVPLVLNAFVGSSRQEDGFGSSRLYPVDYTLKERRELRDLWDTPHSYKMQVDESRPKGMICSAGKKFIYINNDGEVFPCSHIKSSIGNIIDGEVNFQEKDMICPANRCTCGVQNQALRIVDKYYDRTINIRIFYPKENISKKRLYGGYNRSSSLTIRGILGKAKRRFKQAKFVFTKIISKSKAYLKPAKYIIFGARRLFKRVIFDPFWLFRSAQSKTVIAGLGKSGTTILFYTIKKSSPYRGDIKCLFEPTSYLLEKEKHNPKQAILAKILIKEGVIYDSFKEFDKKIKLVRDPRDVSVSDLLYGGGFHRIWHKSTNEIAAKIELLKKKVFNPDRVSTLEIWKAFYDFSPEDLKVFLNRKNELFFKIS